MREVIVAPEYVRVMKMASVRGLVKVIRYDGAGNVVSSMMANQDAVATVLFEQPLG